MVKMHNRAEIKVIHDTVKQEAISDLVAAKTIVNALAENDGRPRLNELTRLISQTRSGLVMISCDAEIRLIDDIANYINTHFVHDRDIDPTKLRLMIQALNTAIYRLDSLDGAGMEETLLGDGAGRVEQTSSGASMKICSGGTLTATLNEVSEAIEPPPNASLEATPSLKKPVSFPDRGSLSKDIDEFFIQESAALLASVIECYEEWRQSPDKTSLEKSLYDALINMKNRALIAGVDEVAELFHYLTDILRIKDEPGLVNQNDVFGFFEESFSGLQTIFQQMRQHLPVAGMNNLLERMNNVISKSHYSCVDKSRISDDARSGIAGRSGGGEIDESNRIEEFKKLHLDNNDLRKQIERHCRINHSLLSSLSQTIESLDQGVEDFLNYSVSHRYKDSSATNSETNQSGKLLNIETSLGARRIKDRLLASTAKIKKIRDKLGSTGKLTEKTLLQLARTSEEFSRTIESSESEFLGHHIPELMRLIETSAARHDKIIKLVVMGEDVNISQQIFKCLWNPLTQLLDCAIENAIALPDARSRSGKDECAELTFAVAQDGSDLVMTVNLDDDGIDLDNHACLEETDAHFLETYENLVVAVSSVGGSVNTHFSHESGNKIVIRIPKLVRRQQVLMIDVDGEFYGIPIADIEDVVHGSQSELKFVSSLHKTRYVFGGHIYRPGHLGRLLTGRSETEYLPKSDSEVVLLVNIQGERFALVANSLLGSREVMVRPPDCQLSTVKVISGTALMNDEILFVLDLAELLEIDRSGFSAADVESEGGDQARSNVTAMIVTDAGDSVINQVLESYKIKVVMACDGEHAMSLLDGQLPDIILIRESSDNVDGHELLGRIRFNDRLRNIPAILFTSSEFLTYNPNEDSFSRESGAGLEVGDMSHIFDAQDCLINNEYELIDNIYSLVGCR